MLITVLIFSVIINLVLGYTVYNMLNKIERYEDTITEYYNAVVNVLNECRELDEKQMFERDDEVGDLFSQLTSIIGELRFIIYDTNKED